MSLRPYPALPIATCLAALLLLAGPRAATAAPKEKGVLWEHTVEMSASGFSMPAQTSRACASTKQWTEPPRGKDDSDCKVKDFKNQGGRMTWKMECTGRDRMTGEGEIVHTGDAYTGKMTMHSSQGDMLMKMRGKKLGGECEVGVVEVPTGAPGGGTRKVDVEQMQRQQQDYLKQHEEAQAKAVENLCGEAVRDMNAQQLTAMNQYCSDPSWKAKFCARLSTLEGMQKLDERGEQMQQQAASYCGKDLAKIRQDLCPQALQDDNAAYVAKHCPAETRALAQRECAGRSYTSVPAKYRSVCAQYARANLEKKSPAAQQGRDAKPAEAKGEEESPADQAKKAVKGFLKF